MSASESVLLIPLTIVFAPNPFTLRVEAPVLSVFALKKTGNPA